MAAKGALDGLVVLDLTTHLSGPFCGMQLGDLGADVIKIESPQGDSMRGAPPFVEGEGAPFMLWNRNKRGITLDLKSPSAQPVLEKRGKWADVLIVNTPHPARKRLTLEYGAVAQWNPRLIYASFTAYGEAGEEAAKTGFDSTAYWARTGLMDMVRADEATVPSRSMPGMGDFPSATGMYAAIVSALYRREKTGLGGVVRSSLLQNGLWANGCSVQTRLFGEQVALRPHRDRYGYHALASGGIGWGLPASVGVSIANPERPVVCYSGDGSAMYSIQALWTAAHHKLPLTIVIVNNGGYRIIKQRLLAFHGDDHYVGMDFVDPPVDFTGLAKSLGLEALRITEAKVVAPALASAFSRPGAKLIEVVVDGSL